MCLSIFSSLFVCRFWNDTGLPFANSSLLSTLAGCGKQLRDQKAARCSLVAGDMAAVTGISDATLLQFNRLILQGKALARSFLAFEGDGDYVQGS